MISRDMHKGDRCFIIGTGPSLCRMDLSYLVDEHTIGVNQAYYCTFPQWGFVPKYFCCSDIHAYKVCMDAYGKTGVETVFIYDYLRAIVGDYPKDFCYDVPRIGEHLWDGASFSSDIETGTNIGKTVVIDLALPAAMYMGFNPIYLIGCDCEPTGHAYPGDKHAQPYTFGHSPCDFESQKKSYQVVREYADMNGIEVYNATSGGKLEAFKRIEYADIWR